MPTIIRTIARRIARAAAAVCDFPHAAAGRLFAASPALALAHDPELAGPPPLRCGSFRDHRPQFPELYD